VSPRFDALSDIPRGFEDLDTYSGLYSGRAEVFVPETEEHVRRIFTFAKRRDRRVTLRAGGHSFDAQALGRDLVVSMRRFDRIRVEPEKEEVVVGAGATWGAILAALEPHGLVPAVTVTTAHATAGGTLSGDCLSRFSPAYGKEGQWIKSFKLLKVDGQCVTCERPKQLSEPDAWTLEDRLYLGAIGGLGYLGAVLEITYKVVRTGRTAGQIGVRTSVQKHHDFDRLAKDLVPAVEKAVEQDPDPSNPKVLDSVWSAIYAHKDGTEDALVFKSIYTDRTWGDRMPLHQPGLPLRVLVEWLMTVGPFPEFMWNFAFRCMYRNGQRFTDTLEGFTFFMDGNRRAKRLAKRLGCKLKTVQQTFIVPSKPKEEGWEKTRSDLVTWLAYAQDHFRRRGLSPALQDVLYLPRDAPFLLSATADMSGFAVSYAFETTDDRVVERAKETFAELADALCDDFGGRVYLVKNVFASRETLARMYGDNARRFVELKREVDPQSILRNDFLRRTLGDLLEPKLRVP
jgi:decaprenylphospho-beta-D-ribofuranose 2-oxidase